MGEKQFHDTDKTRCDMWGILLIVSQMGRDVGRPEISRKVDLTTEKATAWPMCSPNMEEGWRIVDWQPSCYTHCRAAQQIRITANRVASGRPKIDERMERRGITERQTESVSTFTAQ